MLKQAKALVLRNHDEVWSRGNIDAVDEIFAPDFVGHHPGQPDWVGPDAVNRPSSMPVLHFPISPNMSRTSSWKEIASSPGLRHLARIWAPIEAWRRPAGACKWLKWPSFVLLATA